MSRAERPAPAERAPGADQAAGSRREVPMRFLSTRGTPHSAAFAEALERGLAPDGGLYVPGEWPTFTPERLASALEREIGGATAAWTSARALSRLAIRLLEPFAAGSPLEAHLPAIAAEAFRFDAPLVPLEPTVVRLEPALAPPDAAGEAHEPGGSLDLLELFHGPTAAFKDFGARFLAACLARLRRTDGRPLTILVATSGDTGGAVAAAFHRQPGIEVAVLYPKGLVSPTQERQLTCWGDNVRSFAVRGTFDDCQRLVKEAFHDERLRASRALSSANSINLGRLLPQAVYYAAASLAIWRARGEPASFVIPSGNLGNSLACIWARRLGMPIAEVVLAHNANRTVPDFLRTGTWSPRASVATLASAMDVGNPSNMERLRSLYPQIDALRGAVTADTVDDAAIRERIRMGFARYGQVWCPHTATAAEAYERLPAARRRGRPWVIVATAHPAKFTEIVEPLIGRSIAPPETLAQLYARPVSCTEIAPDPAALRGALAH